MKKLTKDLQWKIAKRLAEKGYFTDEQVAGFKKRGNKGMIAEMLLAEKLGLNTSFDNKQGEDLVYRGIKVQFKYMGFGSSPSATETKKAVEETEEMFVERILNKYGEVDEFWIYPENDLDLDLEKMYQLTREEFKNFLLTQNITDNKKIRITGKRTLREMFRR